MIDSLFYIIGGLGVIVIGAVIGLWRKVEHIDAVKVSYKTCQGVQNHQIQINTEVIERLTRVETKVDIGFKDLKNTINGNKNKGGR